MDSFSPGAPAPIEFDPEELFEPVASSGLSASEAFADPVVDYGLLAQLSDLVELHDDHVLVAWPDGYDARIARECVARQRLVPDSRGPADDSLPN